MVIIECLQVIDFSLQFGNIDVLVVGVVIVIDCYYYLFGGNDLIEIIVFYKIVDFNYSLVVLVDLRC